MREIGDRETTIAFITGIGTNNVRDIKGNGCVVSTTEVKILVSSGSSRVAE